MFDAGERAAAVLVAAGAFFGVADGLGNVDELTDGGNCGGWLGEVDGLGDWDEGADGLGAGELVAGVACEKRQLTPRKQDPLWKYLHIVLGLLGLGL